MERRHWLLLALVALCVVNAVAVSTDSQQEGGALSPGGGMAKLVDKVEKKEGIAVRGDKEKPPSQDQDKDTGDDAEDAEDKQPKQEKKPEKAVGERDSEKAVGEKGSDKAVGERDVKKEDEKESTREAVTQKSAPTECFGGSGGAGPRCGVLRLPCPHAGGVCCAGGTHCCPHGYQCASLENAPGCPQCVKAKLSCPGLHSHKSTGLHKHAKNACGEPEPRQEERKEEKKEVEPPKKEEKIEKKEEEEVEEPRKPEKREEIMCKTWWSKAGNACPNSQKRNTDVANDSCAEGECKTMCCKEEEAPVMTCAKFFDDGECPTNSDRNTDNDNERCEKQGCLKTCCKPRPEQTCSTFWSGGGKCQGDSTKALKNKGQKCSDESCPKLCCEKQNTCKDWLDDGGRCSEGREPNVGEKATACEKEQCEEKCCRKMPPKRITCWQYWEDNTCPAPTTDANEKNKKSECLPKECPSLCCQRPPPTCAKFFLAEGKGCPTNGEYVERQEHKTTACRSDAECLAKCCTKLPPKCSTWFNENTCNAPRIRNTANNDARCHGNACEATCCKNPPPFRCAHFWAKERCPAKRPLQNEAHKARECKGNQCIELCCKPRPPPPPTCALHFLLEKCSKQNLLRRTENTFKQCNGAQCDALCCKKPPPFIRRAGRCDWSGDPHWYSFDRVRFDWYGVGEYALYVDPYTNERVHIKTGNSPWARHVSWTTGIAMRVDNDAISFAVDKPFGSWSPRLFVNGKATVIRRGAVYKAGENLQIQMHWQNGMRVWGTPMFTISSLKHPRTGLSVHCVGFSHARFSSMNCYMKVNGFFSPPLTAGICGRFDGNPANDFVRRDGQILASTGGARQANANNMAASWTVPAKDSIFAMRQAAFQQNQGANAKKLTPLQAAKGNTALVSNAYAKCHKAQNLHNCVIDFILSGGNKIALAQNA